MQTESDTILQKHPAHYQIMAEVEEEGKQDRTDENRRSHGAQNIFSVTAIVEPIPKVTQSKLLEKEEKSIELAPSLKNKELELEVDERHLELDVKLGMEKRDLELALRLQEQEVEEEEEEHVEERDLELALDLQEEDNEVMVMSLAGGQR